jgi:myo-inositol-1(or 4)-monophosphatase
MTHRTVSGLHGHLAAPVAAHAASRHLPGARAAVRLRADTFRQEEDPTMTTLESTMRGWAEEAAEIARDHFLRTGPLQFKYAREAVTTADAEMERLLARRITEAFPGDAVHGEELGSGAGNQGPEAGARDVGRIWHIDPIDGTLNFALGLPAFCTSFALMDDDRIEAACVYAILQQECFTAVRGGGCHLGGERVRVSDRSAFGEAIISAQLQKDGRYVQNAALLQALLLRSMKMRRLGTIALELAYLAAGRYDALVAGRGRPQALHDVAAGILLVEEAGGRVTNHLGEPYRPGSTDLVASNGLVHDELIGIIRELDG